MKRKRKLVSLSLNKLRFALLRDGHHVGVTDILDELVSDDLVHLSNLELLAGDEKLRFRFDVQDLTLVTEVNNSVQRIEVDSICEIHAVVIRAFFDEGSEDLGEVCHRVAVDVDGLFVADLQVKVKKLNLMIKV